MWGHGWYKVVIRTSKSGAERCCTIHTQEGLLGKLCLCSNVFPFAVTQAVEQSMFDCAHDVGGSGAARRRRDRRIRMHWRHEQLSLRMLLASMGHHSWQSRTSVGVQTAPAPVAEYVAPAPKAEHTTPSPAVPVVPDPVVYAAPAPGVPLPATTHAATAAPAPVNFVHVTPAPVDVNTDRERMCGVCTCH